MYISIGEISACRSSIPSAKKRKYKKRKSKLKQSRHDQIQYKKQKLNTTLYYSTQFIYTGTNLHISIIWKRETTGSALLDPCDAAGRA
jgi:ubiquitin